MRPAYRWDVFSAHFKRAILLFSMSFPLLWVGWVWHAFQPEERSGVIGYGLDRLASKISQGLGALLAWLQSLTHLAISAADWDDFFPAKDRHTVARVYYPSIDDRLGSASLWIFLISIVVACLGTWLLSAAFGATPAGSRERVLRGADAISWRKLANLTGIAWWKWWRSEERERQLSIGQVPIPLDVETRHILLVGSTGTGKSQSMYQIVEKLRARDDRALILDLNGALLSRFAATGDKILNPLDSRSVKWNPFLDIVDKGDLESLVLAAIPAAQGESEEWRGYSRTIMQAVIAKLHGTENAEPSKVVYYATHAGTKELAQLCAGTAAQRFFEKGNEKLLSNSLPNFAQAVASWAELEDAGSFSLRQWVANGTGWLFINPRDKQFELMRPLISSWIWIAITEALCLTEYEDRRLWFVLDELASYHRLPKFAEALSRLRKYGGCVVATLQDVAQLDDIYGHDRARTLRNCFSTFVALRCEDPDTAEYAARRVGGEQEVERERVSITAGRQFHSQTRSTDKGPREAILPSEIRKLPDRVGYLKISGEYSAAKVDIPICGVPSSVTPVAARANQERIG